VSPNNSKPATLAADVAGYSRLVGTDEEGPIAMLPDSLETIELPLYDTEASPATLFGNDGFSPFCVKTFGDGGF
jgi:hypothetical protein